MLAPPHLLLRVPLWWAGLLATALAAPSAAGAAELATVRIGASGSTAWASADAVVEAVQDTAVASQVPGAVVALNVRVGERVRAGQELVRLDAQAAQQSAAAGAAQAEAARTSARIAATELARQRQLYDKQYVSLAALERAQAQFDAAQAQVRAQQAQANAAAAQSGHSIVRAPYAGVVSEVPVSLGDMAAPGRPLVRLHDPARLRITATASQALAQALASAREAAIELPGAAQPRIPLAPAQVQRLPLVDAATHTVQLRADLPASVAGVAPGMFARLWVSTPSDAATPAVPASAVVRRAEMTGVYVVDDQGRPRLRQVRLGRAVPAATASEGAGVEVLSGLRAGERVALDPQAAAKVR